MQIETQNTQGELKLNLGCGFKKKNQFINVDVGDYCEPEVALDLAKKPWPWLDSSVSEIAFEYSLEQMGDSAKDLQHIFSEAYRVCKSGAKVSIVSWHPRHDMFVNNPFCINPITPDFLSKLSVQNNLKFIGEGNLDNSLGFMWNVNFNLSRVKFLLSPHLQHAIESKLLSEDEIRIKMIHENNICQAIEMDLTVEKSQNSTN